MAPQTTPAPLAVDLRGAAAKLAISRSHLMSLCKEGKIHFVRAGKKLLFPLSSIDDFLAGKVR